MRALTFAVFLAPAFALSAMAQDKPAVPTTPQAEQQSAPAKTAEKTGKELVLTQDQIKAWVGKPVYSSDGKNIGEVAAFARGEDGVVTEMHADIGGFLGLGETRVRLMPAQLELKGDRVLIDMTSAQAKDLPRVE